MTIYVYYCPPIDWWVGWMTETEFLNHRMTNDYWDPHIHRTNPVVTDYVTFTTSAYQLAKEVMWEGDMRDGPYVAGLPDPDAGGWCFVVAWKQDNNGTTFVASHRELEWLKKDNWWASADDDGKVTVCEELVSFRERMHELAKRQCHEPF
jgi:hypothetical protein